MTNGKLDCVEWPVVEAQKNHPSSMDLYDCHESRIVVARVFKKKK